MREGRTGAQERPLRIDIHDDLVIGTNSGEIRFHKPIAYQPSTGNPKGTTQNRKSADGRYVLLAGGRVGIEVVSYDKNKPLVIDPVLTYSTYLGGSGYDGGNALAVDNSGNAYVAGQASSFDFPTLSGDYELNHPTGYCLNGPPCFAGIVTKLNSTGSAALYSTYLGGDGGAFASSVAVDASGNAYITGYAAPPFPTTPGAFQADTQAGFKHAFVTKLGPAGDALVYSTYLSGGGEDGGNAIAIDATGHTYVAGQTSSVHFPVTTSSACSDGSNLADFVSELSADGSGLVYSTCLGKPESAFGIAVDADGNAYVTGYAIEYAACGADGGYVTKLDTSARQVYVSCFKGTGQAIAVDGSGNAYVTGYTSSSGFETTPGAFQTSLQGNQNAFVLEVNPSGTGLVYSTYLGGGYELGSGIALDVAGNAYVTGSTSSVNFPVVNPVQSVCGNCSSIWDSNVFIAEVNAAGSALIYSTYLGGTGPDAGKGIAVDSSGAAYVTGYSNFGDFPTTAGSFQPGFKGPMGEPGDAFIAKISAQNIPAVRTSRSSITFSGRLVGVTSPPETVTLFNNGSGGLNISGITPSGDYAQSNNCGAGIAGGAQCTITVTFTPTATGDRTGAITITDNATSSPQTISLDGTGTFAGISLSNSGLTFGNQIVGTTSPPLTLKVGNSGTGPLTITNVSVQGDFAQTNDCGSEVVLGDNCQISVTFSPTGVGPSVGSLTIASDAPGGPQSVILTGTGVSGTPPLRPLLQPTYSIRRSSPLGQVLPL